MKTSLFILLFLLISLTVGAQEKMIVFLTDKGDSQYVNLSKRAMNRRFKNSVELDDNDRNLYKPYLAELANDCKIINRSKWLNAVTLETTLTAQELQEKYSFIKSISTSNSQAPQPRKDIFNYISPKSFNYGSADTQVRQIGADCLHDLGYTGQGVYLAIIDAGFKGMDTVQYFDSVYNQGRVLDTFDFINNASVYNYSTHGTAVSSCVFGYKGGSLPYAGTAVNVDVALYVSEDAASETLVEEFNLVAALERCDSVGVDVANISLGYLTFDDPSQDHVYTDLDGATTIASIGVNVAASKGIVVVTSAGNSGPSTISTPCDADDGLCVGAVNNQGIYAFFSSVGPASDGAIKPDVVATGWDTWVILDDGSMVMGNGTSFSSPVMAGGVACLIAANPAKTVAQIIDKIQESAHQFSAPDEFLGYGIPALCDANNFLQVIGVDELNDELYSVYPNPTNGILSISGLAQGKFYFVEFLNNLGQVVYSENGLAEELQIDITRLESGMYTLLLNDGEYTQSVIIQD